MKYVIFFRAGLGMEKEAVEKAVLPLAEHVRWSLQGSHTIDKYIAPTSCLETVEIISHIMNETDDTKFIISAKYDVVSGNPKEKVVEFMAYSVRNTFEHAPSKSVNVLVVTSNDEDVLVQVALKLGHPKTSLEPGAYCIVPFKQFARKMRGTRKSAAHS